MTLLSHTVVGKNILPRFCSHLDTRKIKTQNGFLGTSALPTVLQRVPWSDRVLEMCRFSPAERPSKEHSAM